MANRNRIGRLTRQRGAVLVISLLLLLVMTLLGLGASQSTRLQERMAGNQRDVELALQGAEAGLRAAEAQLPSDSILKLCDAADSTCDGYFENTLVDSSQIALDLARQSDEWWERWSRDYPQPDSLAQLQQPPQFVAERIARMRNLAEGDPNLKEVREYFRITSRSRGLTDTAQVVVQSTYGRVTFEK